MPGNFYSEAPADELRRVKAELSRERALVAGLQAALCSARAQLEYLDGERTTGTTACVLAQIDAALSELEKSK